MFSRFKAWLIRLYATFKPTPTMPTYLPENTGFPPVRGIELTDPNRGGIDGELNKPSADLASRTRWLRDALAACRSYVLTGPDAINPNSINTIPLPNNAWNVYWTLEIPAAPIDRQVAVRADIVLTGGLGASNDASATFALGFNSPAPVSEDLANRVALICPKVDSGSLPNRVSGSLAGVFELPANQVGNIVILCRDVANWGGAMSRYYADNRSSIQAITNPDFAV